MLNSLRMPEEMQIHQDPLPNKLNGYLIKLSTYAQRKHPYLDIQPACNVKVMAIDTIELC